MKQFNAFVHRNRGSELMRALGAARFRRLSLFGVRGLLHAINARAEGFPSSSASPLSTKRRELSCEDLARGMETFVRMGRTGHAQARRGSMSAPSSTRS